MSAGSFGIHGFDARFGIVSFPGTFTEFVALPVDVYQRLIGEAAGFISPSSLEGISSAIYSARDLSRVLNHPYGDPNRRYWNKTLKIRMKIALKLLKCPFMYNSFLRKLVLKSGLQSIKIEKANKNR
jgi:flavin-dependent dehydrogenase